MKRYARLLLGVSLVFALTVNAVADQNIQLKSSAYTPKVSAKVADLKDKGISLLAFKNTAGDTRRHAYFNKAQGITYNSADEILEDYLWYSMRKYLWAAGMRVIQAMWSGTPDAPGFELNINSWTDTGFFCEVIITKPTGEPPVQKGFSIAFDPPGANDSSLLETRAYESLDKIFETIFTDPAIKSFLIK